MPKLFRNHSLGVTCPEKKKFNNLFHPRKQKTVLETSVSKGNYVTNNGFQTKMEIT